MWSQRGWVLRDWWSRVQVPLWPRAEFEPGSPWLNSSAALVQSRLVCLLPALGFLTLFCSDICRILLLAGPNLPMTISYQPTYQIYTGKKLTIRKSDVSATPCLTYANQWLWTLSYSWDRIFNLASLDIKTWPKRRTFSSLVLPLYVYLNYCWLSDLVFLMLFVSSFSCKISWP